MNQAKVRWTNLRDLFRRELKKTVKMAKLTGDPESYVPRWRHFRSLLFLKDQMMKDDEVELPCLIFDDSMAKHYPQTILGKYFTVLPITLVSFFLFKNNYKYNQTWSIYEKQANNKILHVNDYL